MEHTPISALPVEAVICCCNHTAHPARLRNTTIINFLPINENFELLLPNLLVGAHMQLEVFPARLWEQSWPTKTGSNGMRVHHAAGLTQRCASPPRLLLLRAHLAASRRLGAARRALTQPAEGRAAHQRRGQSQESPVELHPAARQARPRAHGSAQSSSDSGQNQPAANI